ncbi:60S ribosomal protein L13 [Entophlyctis luteolus]|nr:60S ribosomal protein L13 [Entophlyctis luteolus]KAJ3349162.1 60S ribosomal protein L13 [Entophlyctis luteolus]KAJ3381501.1 60S ribosomal protein L13 [Entophlyctis sp. JEL0112]KAJ3388821.1 60S ribosomal protein L13 [Entophlyctis sp. JEL0112]
MKHNNVLPNQHFRKGWQLRVKTWFDQPGKKKTRRVNRIKKAAAIAPRPIDGLFRPAVRCSTIRYNTKIRAGRGFSLDELEAAGINRKQARSIGISVDHRRKNRSVEGLQANVERLGEYKSKLILFPRKLNKPKSGDSAKADLAEAAQVSHATVLPIVQPPETDLFRKIEGEQKATAYNSLRRARADKKYKGKRDARAKAAAEEEKAKSK